MPQGASRARLFQNHPHSKAQRSTPGLFFKNKLKKKKPSTIYFQHQLPLITLDFMPLKSNQKGQMPALGVSGEGILPPLRLTCLSKQAGQELGTSSLVRLV